MEMKHTFLSEVMRRNASVTCSDVAPPPTSRKFAGLPPNSLMMSIVDMARPAPFTTYKRTNTHTHTHKRTNTHIYKHKRTNTRIYIYIYIYKYTQTYKPTHIYTQTYKPTHIYTQTYKPT